MNLFLTDATSCTNNLWTEVKLLMKEEREKGILDTETKIPSTITAYPAGYVNKDLEKLLVYKPISP